MRVAYLTRYGTERASSRVRCYELRPHLERAGVEVRFLPWSGGMSRWTGARYVRESIRLAAWADIVVLQKPPHPVWLLDLLATANRRLVVDFDDAVWATPLGSVDPAAVLRHRELGRRLSHAIRVSGFVTTGSRLLADAVSRGFPDADVTVLPSSVDLEAVTPARRAAPSGTVAAGWIGSPENLADFAPALDAFRELGNRIRLRIVSSVPLQADGVEADWVPWDLERADDEVAGFDIGLMPLRDDQRSRGRCGFKAIEYMAAGLPVVASPVGASGEVVEHGVTGFLVDGTPAWADALLELAGDAGLRAKLGDAGRAAVERRFSMQANVPTWLAVLERRLRS